jgi:hypothetical protein
MHMYLHCPLHCAPRVRRYSRRSTRGGRVAQASDALTGEPALAPSRLEALRWVHSDSAFRTEGPLYLNSGEEPLQHEAGAEGLSIPALNPCGTHRGARV